MLCRHIAAGNLAVSKRTTRCTNAVPPFHSRLMPDSDSGRDKRRQDMYGALISNFTHKCLPTQWNRGSCIDVGSLLKYQDASAIHKLRNQHTINDADHNEGV